MTDRAEASVALMMLDFSQQRVLLAAMQNNNLSSYVTNGIEARSSEYGGRIRTTAETVRTVAQQLRDDPTTAGAAGMAERGAELVDRIGMYLEQTPLDQMVADAESLGRRQPWMLATVGIAAGIFASRLLKSTAARRNAIEADTP